ncbi:tyrosine-protein kinase [Flammeovirga kamogawensis]|uniref:Polysaccharide biosynthesis tyrosine autokinase n=1 Tax=Flammeovirga kamogawensis TaxID=373891 RepID=A0ABX8GSJ3_9BACT|nr:tyrosine-protein kinase [Flammeovirga kamogawensis]MBB6463725.1 capsular exopolysaccharide synthesis family protein [Flammeovirga kamogawensis]QWG06222.1 polysaccharide biosynthesis tyrosine autokinase [Flammeovirga kamogawensis]TRX68054.1 polysaccharide biosynthesis tyrosine autokinase [Flammeovirga kamogawensis]
MTDFDKEWDDHDNDGDNLSNNIDFDKLEFVIKKKFIWVILILMMAGMCAFLYIRWTPRIYEASTLNQIKLTSSSQDFAEKFGIMNNSLNDGKLESEMALITSGVTYNRVIDSLIDLTVTYQSVGDVRNSELFGDAVPFTFEYPNNIQPALKDLPFLLEFSNGGKNFIITYKIGEQENEIEGKSGQRFSLGGQPIIIRSKSPNVDNNRYSFQFNSKSSITKFIKKNISVLIFDPKANTIQISFKAANREKAVAVLKAINTAYSQLSRESKALVYERALTYLFKQIDTTKDSLALQEKKMRAISYGKDLSSYMEAGPIVGNIQELEKSLSSLKNEKKKYQKLRHFLEADSSIVYIQAYATILTDGSISSSLDELAKLETEALRIKESYTSNTIASNAKLELYKKLRYEVAESIKFAEAFLDDNIRDLQREISKLKTVFYQNIGGDPDLKKIEKRVEIYTSIYDLLTNKMIEVSMAQASTIESSAVINEAYASKIPIAPKKIIAIAISMAIGLFISVIMLVIVYIRMDKISGIKHLERRTGMPILGLIPKYQKEEMPVSKLVVSTDPKSTMSEAFRSVRTNLDFMVSDSFDAENSKDARVISVTSTISGEGKTFIASNLAGIIAMSDKKVIMVDLDLRKPKVHLAFGGSNIKGASSILIGQTTVEECLQDTDIPTLKYISAGPIPPNPSELVMSKNFTSFLTKLKEEYDVVMLDSPPVGLVTDGMIIMRHVTNPIYVVRADYSKVSFIDNANNLYKSSKFPNISIILNSVPDRRSYGGYGYGYGTMSYSSDGFGYGYTYGYESDLSEGDLAYFDEKKKPFWKKLFKNK